MMTGVRTLSRIGAASLVAVLLAACGGERSAPEEEIRAWVDAMHTAAEAKDRGSIVERISEAYADSRGNSRDDIEDRIRLIFLRQATISVFPTIDSIEVIDGTAANVELTVGMAGTNQSALGLSADAYRFELELERGDSDWLLISARWGELGTQPE